MTVAALFDFDGTLYDGHLWRDLANHYRTRKRRRLLVWTYLLSHLALTPLNLLGLLNDERFYGLWARDLAWFLAGLSHQEGLDLQRHLLEGRILPGLRPEALARLRQHQDQGHLVLLVSGSFQELLEMLAGELGIRHVTGTMLAVSRGRYTGRAVGPSMTGQGKVDAVERLAREHRLDFHWPASYAYGDSRTDIPLLASVGHPVAVYPDEVLEAHARAQGWEILGSRPR